MNKIKTILLIGFLFCFSKILYSENFVSTIDSCNSAKIPVIILVQTDTIITNQPIYPPPKRDFKRFGLNMALFTGMSVTVVGLFWILPKSMTNWEKEEIQKYGITYKWTSKVKGGPKWDKDNFFLNYVTHPFAGAYYYMIARSSGFTFYESFLCSVIISTFLWEYGIEALVEYPSYQDLISTPIVGSIFGEAFFHAKKSILRHDKRVMGSRGLANVTLFLIDPFNSFLDVCGYKGKQSTTLDVAPVGFNNFSVKPVWGLRLVVNY